MATQSSKAPDLAAIAEMMAQKAVTALAEGGSAISISVLNYGTRDSRAVWQLLQGDPRFRIVKHEGFMGYIQFARAHSLPDEP